MGALSRWVRVAPLAVFAFACSLIIEDDYVFVAADGGADASSVTARVEPSSDAATQPEPASDAAMRPDPADATGDAPTAPQDPGGGKVPVCVAGTDVAGDCRVRRCDEQGQVEELADDRDEPADPGGGCWRPACSGGTIIQLPREEGIRCGEDATECSDVDRCDGQGNCLPHHRTGQVLRPATPQDCRARVCDDSGLPIDVPSAAACDDGSFCTGTEACTSEGACVSSGNPCPRGDADCSNACDESSDTCTANDVRGTSCGGAALCDGAGACRACLGDEHCSEPAPLCSSEGRCVECVTDAQCQGRVTPAECFRAACVENACTTVVNVGAACGSRADTECDNPDSCGASGQCLPNYEGGGSCGEPGRGCSCDNQGPTCRC